MAEPMQRTGGNMRGSRQLIATDKEVVIAVYQGNALLRDNSMLTGVFLLKFLVFRSSSKC